MSTQTRISEVDLTYDEAAKARIAELRAMRETIPHLVVPTDKKQTRRLSRAASLPPAFVKLTVVATESSTALVRGGSDPNRMRDLTSYADAFEPVAAELEALLLFIRHSVVVARNTAGGLALMCLTVDTPIPPEILQQIAKALQISAESLYERAGLLSPDDKPRVGVREAIAADHDLTAEQRQALLNVYESFVAAHH